VPQGDAGQPTAVVSARSTLQHPRPLQPAEPVRRYERDHPGEMIHIDIKKLGRFNKIGHRIAGDRTGQSHNRGVGWELRADWSAMVWKLPGKDAQSLVTEPRVRRPPWNLDAGTMAHVS
jgi:hypothetical protein